MGQFLRHAGQGFHVLEGVLASLGVARAQARRNELLDERGLPPRAGEERPQVPSVDPEPGKACARCGDIRVAGA